MTDTQTYSGNNHILAPMFHMSVSNPTFVLRVGNKEWNTEWHYYFGPSVVSKRNGDPLKNQPGERSAFWIVATWWNDQGCRVVDGIGVWDYPGTEVVECAKTGRQMTIWKGYGRLGAVREL